MIIYDFWFRNKNQSELNCGQIFSFYIIWFGNASHTRIKKKICDTQQVKNVGMGTIKKNISHFLSQSDVNMKMSVVWKNFKRFPCKWFIFAGIRLNSCYTMELSNMNILIGQKAFNDFYISIILYCNFIN